MEKKRLVSFCSDENLPRHLNSPLLEAENELISEFDTKSWEVIKKRKKEVDDIPVQISFFVYQVFFYLDEP